MYADLSRMKSKLKYYVQVKEVENQWGRQGENAESVTEFGAQTEWSEK